jgi:hypothetical protein
MATPEVQKIQDGLDASFAVFRQEYPELVEAMRVLNIPYAEYLRMMVGLRYEPDTISGNSHTPTT